MTPQVSGCQKSDKHHPHVPEQSCRTARDERATGSDTFLHLTCGYPSTRCALLPPHLVHILRIESISPFQGIPSSLYYPGIRDRPAAVLFCESHPLPLRPVRKITPPFCFILLQHLCPAMTIHLRRCPRH